MPPSVRMDAPLPTMKKQKSCIQPASVKDVSTVRGLYLRPRAAASRRNDNKEAKTNDPVGDHNAVPRGRKNKGDSCDLMRLGRSGDSRNKHGKVHPKDVARRERNVKKTRPVKSDKRKVRKFDRSQKGGWPKEGPSPPKTKNKQIGRASCRERV